MKVRRKRRLKKWVRFGLIPTIITIMSTSFIFKLIFVKKVNDITNDIVNLIAIDQTGEIDIIDEDSYIIIGGSNNESSTKITYWDFASKTGGYDLNALPTMEELKGSLNLPGLFKDSVVNIRQALEFRDLVIEICSRPEIKVRPELMLGIIMAEGDFKLYLQNPKEGIYTQLSKHASGDSFIQMLSDEWDYQPSIK